MARKRKTKIEFPPLPITGGPRAHSRRVCVYDGNVKTPPAALQQEGRVIRFNKETLSGNPKEPRLVRQS